MKLKFLHTAIVAAVVLSAGPAGAVHDRPGEPMYRYLHYNNGQLVGVAMDACTSFGVSAYPVWQWGYATPDNTSYQWATCHDGVEGPIE